MLFFLAAVRPLWSERRLAGSSGANPYFPPHYSGFIAAGLHVYSSCRPRPGLPRAAIMAIGRVLSSFLFCTMPASIRRLQTAQQQGTATGELLAETVQGLHLASPLSPTQQAQFRRCCAHLLASASQASCPELLLAADVCFNHAYQLGKPTAQGCPRHPVDKHERVR
jgi:hypothetical protein